mgnify:CR=1 FL=1
MKRNKFLKFAVDTVEDRIIRQKAKSKGLQLSEFVRGLCMSYDISYKLSATEVSAYITLVKFSDEFRVLGQLFEKAEYDEAAKMAAEMSREIRQHLMQNFK